MIEFFGHLHPLLVHLPIGMLLIALLLQWLSHKGKYKGLQPAVSISLLAGAISALFSCITGYMLSTTDDYDKTIVSWHMWMAIALTLTSLVLYAKEQNPQFPASKNVLAVGLFVLIMVTGHLGGSLTHGSDYLTKPLVNIFSGDSAASLTIKPLANVQEAQVYANIVKPILETKCYGCHGATKQKGGLRMDDSLRLLKGGKDGLVINTGNAEKSELMKRITLSLDDDDHMPPKEKPQLTKNQVALLHWWIDNGADFNKKVKEVQQSPEIKQKLTALQIVEKPKSNTSDIPTAPTEAADEKLLNKLRGQHILVLPVARANNYLTVSFITDTIVTNEALTDLQQLNKQLLWLKLSNTNISDTALQYVSRLANLTRLDLSNTTITDAGIKQLTALPHLQYLNLVNTNVTTQGVVQLKNIKSLRELFLYRTQVDKIHFNELKKQFPKTTIDTGGYTVPTLPTDTTEVKVKKEY